MSISSVRSTARHAQALWIAAVLVVAAGYMFVFRTLEIRIATGMIDLDHAATSLERNAIIVRERPVLERRGREADERLGSLLLRTDRPAMVAEFVRESAQIADVHRIRVTAIEAPIESAAPRFESDRFDAVPLDLTLSGPYRDLLRAMRDLSRGRILADIHVASLERTARAGTAPQQLALRVHVRLLRPRERARGASVPDGDPHVRP